MRRALVITLVAAAALAVVPLLYEGFYLRVLTSMFMYGIIAESVNIIAGYTGYLALGNILFFGTGAYVGSVVMTRLDVPLVPAIIIAGVGCAAYAVIIGFAVLRLSGRYFLLATIGLAELTREIVVKLEVTGGGSGISLPVIQGSPGEVYRLFYYLMLAILVLTVVVTIFIVKRKLGYGLMSIRFNEEAAAVMGVPTVKYKTIAWAVSAFFTGMAGAVFANWMAFIEPPVVFSVATSIKMFLMYIFGGAGTIFGPVVGAFSIDLLSELVWERFNEIHYLILGGLVITVVMFMPQGLAPIAPRLSNWLKGRWLRLRVLGGDRVANE